MTIGFPNRSRSYDPEHRRIRFWGHDASLEVQFYLEEDALLKLLPSTGSAETAILAAFEFGMGAHHRGRRADYAPKRRGSFYVLSAADF